MSSCPKKTDKAQIFEKPPGSLDSGPKRGHVWGNVFYGNPIHSNASRVSMQIRDW